MSEENQGFRAIALPALEGIRLLLGNLGNPQAALRCIHVAGTNGKGSVCAYLQKMFTKAGFRTGKFISPHLIHECERISVDGEGISPAELERLMKKVHAAVKITEQITGTPPTMFEQWTAAAFCYFFECGCQMVILETGLGGAHDATNIIPPPEISVITRIAMDHMDYLGDSLAQIASAKAGIIKRRADGKPGCTVTVPQPAPAAAVLEEVCRERENQLIITGQPIIHKPDSIGECFDYADIRNVRLKMYGYHQIENACLAAEAARYAGLPAEAIRFGMENAVNPGRFEMAAEDLIFDGAHNPDGVRALMQGLDRYFPDRKRSIIFGCMRDKDIHGMLNAAAEAAEMIEAVYTVEVKGGSRAMPANELAEVFRKKGIYAVPCGSVAQAVCLAQQTGSLVVVCGSLYLYQSLYTEYLVKLQG